VKGTGIFEQGRLGRRGNLGGKAGSKGAAWQSLRIFLREKKIGTRLMVCIASLGRSLKKTKGEKQALRLGEGKKVLRMRRGKDLIYQEGGRRKGKKRERNKSSSSVRELA